MEGFCRASSPLSIADSMARFNEKWPKNRGFLDSREADPSAPYDLSTTAPQGWPVIVHQGETRPFQCDAELVADRFSVTYQLSQSSREPPDKATSRCRPSTSHDWRAAFARISTV
jgi:hypothetical protein